VLVIVIHASPNLQIKHKKQNNDLFAIILVSNSMLLPRSRPLTNLSRPQEGSDPIVWP